MKNRTITWDKLALNQFKLSIEYIASESPQNANKVRLEIIQKIDDLLANPEIYPPDKFKSENNGQYRAFEIYRLRIAYYIAHEEIRILRIRHASREPKSY